MSNEQKYTNPNDFKVVSFHNSTDFNFTPEMGCMYDGRPISGESGQIGIVAGEKMTLPYHIGHRLAVNLAKQVMVRQSPTVDLAGVPTGVPIWDDAKLESFKTSFMADLYTEAKPARESETDLLMAKVEELKKFVEANITPKSEEQTVPLDVTTEDGNLPPVTVFKDKAEVLAELDKRQIKHNKRDSKDELEKLLA